MSHTRRSMIAPSILPGETAVRAPALADRFLRLVFFTAFFFAMRS